MPPSIYPKSFFRCLGIGTTEAQPQEAAAAERKRQQQQQQQRHNPRAAAMTSSRFEDNFWGENDDGFAVLLGRIKQGKSTCKEILEVVATRAAIEEDYSKKLSKLAKVITAKDEVGTMRDALDALRSGLEQSAQSHMNLATEMRAQIEKPLTDMLKEQTVERKNQEKVADKALKTKKAQIALVGKTRKNYENKVKESEETAAAAQRGSGNPKDAEKLTTKSKKASAAAENADLEYKNSVDKLHEVTDQWVGVHKTACQVFQKMEEERVENAKNFLWSMMNLFSTACVADDECYRGIHEVVQKINGDNDIQLFVTERATGSTPPPVLTYEPIAHGTYAGNNGSALSLSAQSPMEDAPRKLVAQASSPSIPVSAAPPLVGKGLFNVRVMYDYDPQGDEELALVEGEVFPVISTEEDPWWEGEKDGRTGMFPSNFVTKL